MDTLTRSGAEALALHIKRHWADKGFIIKAWIDEVRVSKKQETLYVVRSNMVDGLPSRQSTRVLQLKTAAGIPTT